MEEKNLNPGKPIFDSKGDFSIIVNSDCVGEDGCSSILFAENLSLDSSIAFAMNLHKIVCSNARIYVVHRSLVEFYLTSYTLLLCRIDYEK